MNRKDYIAGLEDVRARIMTIASAFAAVNLTDATDMESDRRKKTAKALDDLTDRLYEDVAISEKVAADRAKNGIGEQGDLFDAEAQEATPAEAVPTEPLALPAPEETGDKSTRKKGRRK